MEYNITDKEFREYVDKLLIYLIEKEDGSLIYVRTEQQREALKTIIDADWSLAEWLRTYILHMFSMDQKK